MNIAFGSCNPHPFFLERMAYAQWNNKTPFISGPNIAVDSTDYWTLASRIEHCLEYYMKPYSLTAYGYNIDTECFDNNKPTLLARTWLQSTDKNNRVLLFMEPTDDLDYMVAINNHSWLPSTTEMNGSVKQFKQSLERDTKKGRWTIHMTPSLV
jgi:hypothetical protein